MNKLPVFGTINFQTFLTVSEVARIIEFLKKTGELLLPDQPTAKINFIDGKIVHAKFDQQEGNEAAVRILQLSDCNVSFTIGPKTQQSTVTLELSKLLEKAAQPIVAQAEQKASEKTIPVAITSPPQTEFPAATTAASTIHTTPTTNAPSSDAITPADKTITSQSRQHAETSTVQKHAPDPVPDTLKPSHGNPPTAPAATQQTPLATSSAPSATAGTPLQQKQPTSAPAGAAKKPILRITLKGVSKDFPIIPGKLMTIGRTPDNDICIPDGQISTRHATLLLDAKGMHLVDQNSLNGVYFGGKKVTEIWLKPNDQFHLAEIPVIVTLA